MKSYKIFIILLIIIVVFSLSLTGCSPEPEVNPPENQEYDENSQLNEDNDNQELDESKNEKTDAEKDQIKENEPKEDSEDSVESYDENNSYNEDLEEPAEEESASENSTSGDTNSQEYAKPEEDSEIVEPEEDSQDEEINILKIEGSVENPLFLNLDDLKEMKDFIYTGTFYSLNSFGTTEYTDFKGVRLWSLLNDEALISQDASRVKVIAVDGYSIEFTVEQIKRDDYIDETNQDVKLPVIIAWEENGEEYNPEEGPPYKLVIGQKEPGDVNKPQWVRDIDKIIVE